MVEYVPARRSPHKVIPTNVHQADYTVDVLVWILYLGLRVRHHWHSLVKVLAGTSLLTSAYVTWHPLRLHSESFPTAIKHQSKNAN